MDRLLNTLMRQNQLLKNRVDLIEEFVLSDVRLGTSPGFSPVADPPPDPGLGGGGGRPGFPSVTDPSPVDFRNARLIDLIQKLRGGVVDPVPEDLLNVRVSDLIPLIPGGGVVDPAPEDFAHLDKDQLSARLTEIEISRSRLDKLQGMIQAQLDGAG